VLVVAELVCWYLNKSRGVGWMFVFFIVLVAVLNYALTRTKWGRSMFAVGGILGAARLGSANQSSGTGDVNLDAIAAAVIGGTSLFGGRGSAFSALLGIVVIQSISSGLTLLSLDSSFRFMVTGAVLLLAVMLDSVSRRSRTSHGRA
ncbi:MAG: sugar ABC transporter permease, partial [Actinomycetota bacterium]|nr:sugar ABC transporter permease [Actinomycetota bacterium]